MGKNFEKLTTKLQKLKTKLKIFGLEKNIFNDFYRMENLICKLSFS